MLDQLYAHIDQKDPSKRQSLYAHLLQTAEASKAIGDKVGLGAMSYLIGLLHDVGKAQPAFQEKILNNTKAFVDHSTMGGFFIYQIFLCVGSIGSNRDLLKSRIKQADLTYIYSYTHVLIYTILSHHGQYNLVRQNLENRYVYTSFERLGKVQDGESLFKDVNVFLTQKGISLVDLYLDGFDEYLKIMHKLEELETNFSAPETQHPNSPNQKSFARGTHPALPFYQSMLCRLLVSILKSCDIKDTINSYEELIIDPAPERLQEVIHDFEQKVRDRYASFGEPQTPLDQVRSKIAGDILTRAREDGPGIYELNLPTGAGKTLLSLRYGMNQMSYQGKERFFYVTSFLSVLEQNASEMKQILQNEEFVLEHHSNVVQDQELSTTRTDRLDEEDDSLAVVRQKYLLDDWTSPVVLTTMVQFFNSIFKGKSSNLTRFKSLINSVIILDEWQTLPVDYLYMINLSLNFLKVVMHATVVLSTATQPTNDLVSLDHRLAYGDASGLHRNMISLSKEEAKVFHRVDLALYGDINEGCTVEDLEDLVRQHRDQSILIILNTKSVVRKLYDLLLNDYAPEDLYYLTTNLTAADRLKRIATIKERLNAGDRICVVSTQLIEAGVDVDFDLVIRSLSGLDSIVQAMGRCNREGKKAKGLTYVVNLDKNVERINSLKGMKERKDAAGYVFDDPKAPYELDKMTQNYFWKLYANLGKELSCIFGLLADNPEAADMVRKQVLPTLQTSQIANHLGISMVQAFRTAYDKFSLIDEDQETAVVLCDETQEAVDEIRNLEAQFNRKPDLSILAQIRKLVRHLSRYTVPVAERNLDHCENILLGTVYIVPAEFYQPTFGVDFEEPEVLML